MSQDILFDAALVYITEMGENPPTHPEALAILKSHAAQRAWLQVRFIHFSESRTKWWNGKTKPLAHAIGWDGTGDPDVWTLSQLDAQYKKHEHWAFKSFSQLNQEYAP